MASDTEIRRQRAQAARESAARKQAAKQNPLPSTGGMGGSGTGWQRGLGAKGFSAAEQRYIKKQSGGW